MHGTAFKFIVHAKPKVHDAISFKARLWSFLNLPSTFGDSA